MVVFFCHSSQDKPLIREIIQLFRSHSALFKPWLDEREIRVADDLRTTLRSAIESSGFVVALLSPNTTDSYWVNFELGVAYDSGVKILPIILDLDPEQLPEHIRERRYLTLHDRSEEDLRRVVQELCRDIAKWMSSNDELTALLERHADIFQAEAIKEGQEAATVCIALLDLLPKLIRAVYFKEYADTEHPHLPPTWLIECCSFTITYFSTSDLSKDKETTPEMLTFIDKYRALLGQCFFMGYYAMRLRQPLLGRMVDENNDYEVAQLWAGFNEIVQRKMDNPLDVKIWNLGLRLSHVIYVAMVNKNIIPESDYAEELLTKAMFWGFTLARAVEWVSIGKGRE